MRFFCLLLLAVSGTLKATTADCDGLVQTVSCNKLTDIINVQNISAQYPLLKRILSDPNRFRLQIIYTQIDRDSNNQPQLTYYTQGLDAQQYYYPASTVKLPISLLALEWLNEAGHQVVTMNSPMLTDAIALWQTPAHNDVSAESGLPSIAHYIKKILLVSDNNASNRLYELLGQERINSRLSQLGLHNSIINHRLSLSLTEEQNRQYNPIRFLAADGSVTFSLPQRQSAQQYINKDRPVLGSAYLLDGRLVQRPMDFTYKNRLSLQDLDGIVKRLVFPELFIQTQQLKLTAEQRQFVLRYMSMLPDKSDYPAYDKTLYPDNYSKFLLFGGASQSIPDHIRIFNKTGWAYGHLIDSAYIIDLQHNVEFFVSAVIYANQNDILNDDTYETEQVGLPLLNELGQFIYQHELKRARNQEPDLSYFKQIIN